MIEKGQIQKDNGERQQLVDRIISDMRANRTWYKAGFMLVLFGRTPAPEWLLAENTNVGRFLRQGYSLTFEDLYCGGVLPPDIHELRSAIFKYEFLVPQEGMECLGDLESGRTDVFFLGQTYSGHSCMLAGVVKYLHDYGKGVYVPHKNKDGRDLCVQYCNAMLRGLDECKLPQSTSVDTMSFIQYNIGDEFDQKVTFVEYGDGALARLSRAVSDDPGIWNRESLCRCLKNDNSKTLFFVLSYEMISNNNPRFSEPHQAEILENALLALCTDGDGKNGAKKCVMSKVQTVAIVFSNSDLMDKIAGRVLNRIERMKIAMDYLNNRLKTFMNNMCDICKKYGINKNNRNKPFVFTFSLGDFYIGNSVVYDPKDSECICDFLIATTPKRKSNLLYSTFINTP